MVCPNCNKNLPDGSIACNFCGYALNQFAVQRQTGQLMTYPVAAPQMPQKTPEQTGAELELAQIKKDSTKELCYMGLVGGSIFVIYGLAKFNIIGIVLGMFFVILSIVKLIETKNRIEQLKNIASGRKMVSVCPMCKSPNIQIGLVETGSTAVHGVSTVGQNINPLRPFTHTNIHQGNTYTSNSYGSKGVCLNCGCSFDEPEKFFM